MAYGGLLDKIAISDRAIFKLTLSHQRQSQDAFVFQSAIDVARRLALVLIGNALHVVAWMQNSPFAIQCEINKLPLMELRLAGIWRYRVQLPP